MIDAGAILFDLDGLMVDSEPLWLEVERDFARRHGGDWTEELAEACVGKGLLNTLVVMGETFHFAVDPVTMIDEIIDAFLARARELRLKPGCLELVTLAHQRVPCAVASSSHGRLVRTVLEQVGLARFFEIVVTGDIVPRPKPAPDVFLAAAARLNVPPARCVVLEDAMAGVLAARAAGMRVIAVPEHDPAPFAGMADAVVHDLFEARAQLVF